MDVGCYQKLHQTYTSHITGATASTASHLVLAMWPGAGRSALAIGSFILGLLISASLRHIERRKRIRSAFAVVLAIEIVLIGVFIACGAQAAFPIEPLIFFAACAMGMQTVTVTRVGKVRVYTTFHTGNASKFSEAMTSYLFWAWDRTRGRFRARLFRVLRVTARQETAQQTAVTAGVWIAFLAGAVSAAAAVGAWGLTALILPMFPLAAAILADWKAPSALGEKTCDTDPD